MAEMYGWATHQHFLIAAVMNTAGPVLELGCGHYSTPLLHEICKAQGRVVYSFDLEKNWVSKFMHLRKDEPTENGFNHFVETVGSVDNWCLVMGDGLYMGETPGVIFIDHSPAERRQVDIERLKDSCEFMVVHDTEKAKFYKYDFSMFKYRYTDKQHKKQTTILSNVRDPKELFE